MRTSTALGPVKHLTYRKCLTSVHFASLSGLGGMGCGLCGCESHLPRKEGKNLADFLWALTMCWALHKA